jgi:hypothetical protein
MEFALVIVALLAIVVLAFWIKRRRLSRASLEIIERFRQHGALREGKAKTLEQMGLHSRPKHPFMMRDEQVEALSLLLQQGIICQVEQKGDTEETAEVKEARFYLREEKYPTP